MALSCKVGSFATGTGAVSSTVVVSDVGFQPKVIFFMWNGRLESTDTVGRANHGSGFGVAISTTDRRCMTSLAQDTPTAMVTNHVQRDASCICTTTTADAIDGELDLQSMDSGGFTLVVDDQFATSVRVQYLALGGSDILNVKGGAFAKIGTTGTQNMTSVGFQADGLIMFGINSTSANAAVAIDCNNFLGWAQNASKQGLWVGASNDAAANAQSISYLKDDQCVGHMNAAASAVENRAAFTGFTPTGFDLNWLSSSSSLYQIHYVAIKGCAVDIGSFLTQTNTSTTIPARTGFEPKGGLIMSHCKPESTDNTAQDDDEFSIGTFTSTSARQAMGRIDNDAAATAEVTTAVEYDAVYVSLTDNGGTLQGLADVNAVTTTGFELIMDDADPAQAMMLYMVFGNSPVLPERQTRQMRYNALLRR